MCICQNDNNLTILYKKRPKHKHNLLIFIKILYIILVSLVQFYCIKLKYFTITTNKHINNYEHT